MSIARRIRPMAVSCLLAGCGSAASDEPARTSAPEPSMSLAQFFDEVARVACEHEVRCTLSPTVESCLLRGAPEVRFLLPNVGRAQLDADVAAGLTRFDAAAAESCIAAVATLGCDWHGLPVESCQDVLRGVAGADEACTTAGIRCEGDATCIQQECDEAGCCTGICKRTLPLGAIGEACIYSGCVADAWCRPPGVCYAAAKENEPCNPAPCVRGLFCDTSTSTPACKPLPVEGESCAAAFTCAEDWRVSCNYTSLQCVKRPGAGEPCSAESEPCLGNLLCSAGVCAWQLDLGSPCPDGYCLSGAYCESGTCVAAPPETAPVCP